MADSVALLGWDEDPIRVIQDVDWLLDDRADSTNQVRVTTSLAEADGIDAEQELIFKERGFTISGVERDRAADEAVITADEHQAALADVVIVGFRPNSWTLTRAMNAVLADTRWTLGEVSGTRYGRADFDEITALDALHFLARHQDAELSFDSLRRRVNITPDTGTAHEYVFTYGRQLSNIEKDVQQPTTTVIYPTMADDVVLDPVEDYGYYLAQGISLAEAKARFRKEEYWDDSRYEIAENMTRDAQKRLEEEAYPRTTYVLTAQATVDVEGADDFDLAELRLGDTVYVWDQEIDTKLSAEVTAVTTSSDQSQNELTLSTLPASLGDSVSDRGYFGDSGKPSSGGTRRSGPQPKPSMPILEQVSDYGTAVTRWNGQDSEGNFNTIPQRFGTLLTLVAPLTDGVIPSPNDSSQTFMGSDITKRGGGLSNIGFNGYGEFAVWHQMRGWDGMTLSEFSEPLVVDVPPAWDPQPTVDKLDNLNDVRLPELDADLEDARQRITDADERLTAGQQTLTGNLEDLDTRVGPALDQSISKAVSQAQGNIQDFENRWDTQWDETIPALKSRQDTLEDDLTTGLQGAASDLQEFRDEWDANWEPGAFDELRNRADTLEGDLATGLTQAHNQAEAMAEAARDDAVSMAAADAQSEYDRLQEIAERALSRAGDNVLEDPSFETDYWFNMFEGAWGRTYTPTTIHRTGDQAMEISDGSSWNLSFDTLDVEEGESWRLSIWYRTSGAPSMGSTELRVRDQVGGSVLASSEPFTVSENEFRRAVVTYTVPPDVTTLAPTLFLATSGGQVALDDVAFQEVGAAAEALRLAETARQQAEAAHIAAGEATDTAADAYDAASSKSTVHWSLSAPSGTADNSDDVWWQYEVRNGRRVVIGQWFWDDGVWRETEIAEEWLPQVNIGTGTYGDMSGDRLEANTVKAGKMLVGPRNIITDPGFDSLGSGSIDDGWGSYTGGWGVYNLIWSDRTVARILNEALADDGTTAIHYGGAGRAAASLPCEPGETFKVRFQVGRYAGWSSDDDYRAQVRWVGANGNGVDWSTFQFGADYSHESWVEFEATAPEGAAWFYFRFAKHGVAAGRRGVGNLSIQSMTGSDLIVQGAVKAEHVDSVSLTASEAFLDNAMVNLIQGRMANFDEALIGGALIKDNAISAGKLTVMPDGADFAPGPGGFEDLWTVGSNNAIVSASKDPSGAQLRVSPGGGAGNSTRTYGPWIRAQAGDTIYYRMYVGRTDSPDAALRVYFMYDGSVTSWDRVWEENAGGWVEGVHTVPDGVESTVTLSFVTSGGTQGNYWIRYMDVRKQVKGVLIEPEGIKSPQVDTAELTASSAFLDNAMVNLIQGRMANFDEALIGGALLKDNSIATRHLVVADATNFAPEPGEYEAAWSFVRARVIGNISAYEGAAIALDNTASSSSQVRGPLLAVYPGDTIYVGAQLGYGEGAPTSGGVYLRMEWFEDADSSRETYTTAAYTTDASLWLEGTVTVPDYATHARFYVYASDTSGNPGTRRIRSTKVRVQTGGELIVDGSINSAKVNTQEFFAAQAVIDEVWTNIVRSRLIESQGIITEDMIATGAITTPKLVSDAVKARNLDVEEIFFNSAVGNTVAAGVGEFLELNADQIRSNSWTGVVATGATFQTHADANQGVKMTPAGLRGWDGGGDLSFRFDGTNNFLRGSIHAGVGAGSEVHVDYGRVYVQNADETYRTVNSPYVSFDSDVSSTPPMLWVDPATGALRITAGRQSSTPPFRGRVRVAGDLGANRLDGNQLLVRGGISDGDEGDRVGGMLNSNGDVRIIGRATQTTAPEDMLVMGDGGNNMRVVSPTGTYRSDILYGAPSETGIRRPYVSTHLSTNSHGASRLVATTTANRSSVGFEARTRQLANNPTGDAGFYLNYIGVWA